MSSCDNYLYGNYLEITHTVCTIASTAYVTRCKSLRGSKELLTTPFDEPIASKNSYLLSRCDMGFNIISNQADDTMSNPLRHGQDMISQAELKNRFYQVDYGCFLPSLDPCIQIALSSKTLYTFPVICYINRKSTNQYSHVSTRKAPFAMIQGHGHRAYFYIVSVHLPKCANTLLFKLFDHLIH